MPSVFEADQLEQAVELPELHYGGPSGGGPHDPGPDWHGGGGGGDDEDSGYSADMGLLGMRILLVSIMALFIALSIAYFARSRASQFWEPVHVPRLLWFSTAVIILSSATLQRARAALDARSLAGFRRWLGITVVLGLLFLLTQAISLEMLIGQGIYLRGNPHSAMFFIITALHAVHLLAGIFMLFLPLVRALFYPLSLFANLGKQQARMSIAALYWHSLDGLWIAMFALLLFVGR